MQNARYMLFCFLLLLLHSSLVFTTSRPSQCELPRVVGHCRAMIPMFYFDVDTNQCEQFYYGGCGGNDNRFSTQEDCIRHCMHERSFWDIGLK